MSSEHPLMRPLGSDNLKPRPSTQASWMPQAPVRTYEVPDLSFAVTPKAVEPAAQEEPETFVPAEESSETPLQAEEAFEPAAKEEPKVFVPAEEPSVTPLQAEEVFEPAAKEGQEAFVPAEEPSETPSQAEELSEPAVQQEEISLTDSIAFLIGDQDEPPAEDAPALPLWEDDPIPAEEEAAPAPMRREGDLSAVIAALLSETDDEDEDEDSPVLHDAVPDRFIPEPACVPLFDENAPKRKKRGWLWLLALAAVAGGLFAAWKFGCLPVNLPWTKP